MEPRLIALIGPANGETFALGRERFTIGRQADNDLQLSGLEVSRHHCELRRGEDGHYSVIDLDSRHGVFVNHRPVRERRLVHSDLLRIGNFLLLFLLDDSSASKAPGEGSPERGSPFRVGSTLARKPTEIFYLDAARVDTALPAEAHLGRDLHALLRASQALQGPLSVTELAGRLLTTLFEIVPAHRGAVLLVEPGEREASPVAWRTRDERAGEEGALFATDHAILDQVLDTGTAVLGVGELSGHGHRPGAVLVVPLLDRDRECTGVVYADAPSTEAFEERHLELLGAVAGIASLALENTLHLRWLERENRRLRSHQLDHDMVGESVAMRRLLDLVARVARTDSTVLLRGESGTGKELTAQAIHRSSPRAEAPFVAINGATLSETLLESELFGHEKGAFTGAVEKKVGKLEVARGGTLFLDEVGELPPGVQAKLLRVLAERRFERVGGTRCLEADVRVVAATNRDLEAAIREGSFRADLYYRLKVITLETPPLRRRRDDIPLLASHFAALHGRRLGRPRVGIAPAARRALVTYDWPGNVRELGNAIERAVVLGDGEVITPEDLPDEVVEGSTLAAPPGEFHSALREYKKKLVLDAYRQTGGDYGAAAELLGIHVNSLHRMIARLGIKDRLRG